jgi:hypothetical protein
LIASTVITAIGLNENVSLGFPMKYVEAYASRVGFVHPRDGKIL